MSEAAAAAESRETRENPALKHFANAGDAVLKQWGSLIPDAFWTHGKVARKEFLLGVTTLVDEAIRVIDPPEILPGTKCYAQRQQERECAGVLTC